MTTIHQFEAELLDGSNKSFADYEGKVLLIVNTASKCGFTPQFADLENLYREYGNAGLEILGFPSNQFAGQEPGNDHEVQNFCEVNYGVSFPIFAKGDVRGDDSNPLFTYLSEAIPFTGLDEATPQGKGLQDFLKENFPQYLEGNGVKWNFTKFLIDRKGDLVKRFESPVSPVDMVEDIKRIL